MLHVGMLSLPIPIAAATLRRILHKKSGYETNFVGGVSFAVPNCHTEQGREAAACPSGVGNTSEQLPIELLLTGPGQGSPRTPVSPSVYSEGTFVCNWKKAPGRRAGQSSSFFKARTPIEQCRALNQFFTLGVIVNPGIAI